MALHGPGTRCVLCVLLASSGIACATERTIYDANFDSQPLGTLATQPRTDPLPLRLPTSIIQNANCTVNAVSSAGDLTSKPVLLSSVPGGLASATFCNPTQYTTGSYRVSWDSLVLNNPVNDPPEQDNVSILVELSGSGLNSWKLKYMPDGKFGIVDGAGAGEYGTFAVGFATHFDLLLDLDEGQYQLYVNRAFLHGGPLIHKLFKGTYFRSNGRTGLQVPRFAFDNLHVVTPAPASLSPHALGGVAVMRRQRQ